MNEKPSTYSVIFSYLLILIMTGVLIAMNGTGKTYAHNVTGSDEISIVDSIALINAEANLPIYSAPEEHSAAISLDTEMMLAHATIDQAGTKVLPEVIRDDMYTWYIRIASLTNKINAKIFVARAKEKGIDATKEYVTVNGKNYWRVFVKVLLSHDEAKSYAALVKERLGLKEFWISKESDQSRSGNAAHKDDELKATTEYPAGEIT